MRITISPITIGDKTCVEAEVSAAISSTAAIRVVPVDTDGIEYPEAAIGVVGGTDQPDMADFITAVEQALTKLTSGRGI
jgi:hypothetical protein